MQTDLLELLHLNAEEQADMEGFEQESHSLIGLKHAFRSGKTRGIDWRKAQLRALLKLIAENEARIFEALEQDLGKHPVEAYRDEVCFSKFQSFLFGA